MSKKPTAATKTAPNPREVNSISQLARLVDVHRQTVAAWIDDDGLPWLTKKPRANGGFDYTFDLGAVFEWRHGRGYKEGRAAAAKAAEADGAPRDDGVIWVHPTTGEEFTDKMVALAVMRKTVADAGTAEHKEHVAGVKRLEADLKIALCEDVLSNHRYTMTMITAGLAAMADTNRREFEGLGMHPDEARRKANAPIEDMARYLAETSPFDDPLAETNGDDDEAVLGVVESDESKVPYDAGGHSYDDEDGSAEDDAGDLAGEAEPQFTDDGDPVE